MLRTELLNFFMRLLYLIPFAKNNCIFDKAGARSLNQAQPVLKQLNLNKLSDASGVKMWDCRGSHKVKLFFASGIIFLSLSISAVAVQPRCFQDNGIYPEHCKSLAQEEARFAHFKRDPLFTLFSENVSEKEGEAELKALVAKAPELLESVKQRRALDLVGDPRTFSYGAHGELSPAVLRYARVVADLKRHFGDLSSYRVVEIGGGYGGLCTLMHALAPPKSYALLDLPESLDLSQRYLRAQKIGGVELLPLSAKPEQVDLVISYLFFSECDRSLQTAYIEKILSQARAGYLICAPAHWKEIPYSEKEHKRVKPLAQQKLLSELKAHGIEAKVVNEEPASGKGHFILYWGDQRCSLKIGEMRESS
ncbi:MAG: putative sugar O-methyltransferase [Chlamydiales bacterium]|nr:putative sugar O-methyltransferase [Chlamydiales bacterium]